MGTLITLLIVIPLCYYVGAFWIRLLRPVAERLARRAAEGRPWRERGPHRGWEYRPPGPGEQPQAKPAE